MSGHGLGEPPHPLPEGGNVVEWDPGDQAWWRAYHRDYRTPGPLHRRTFGPISRFDHHQASADAPVEDPDERSVVYLGVDLHVACAELFWDQKPDEYNPGADPFVARVCTRHHIAQVRPRALVPLLSILGADVDLIGALPELCTGPTDDHPIAQAWARAIYESEHYTQRGVCGIRYRGAHDFGECMVLWDRAPQLEVVQELVGERDRPLHEPGVWERVLKEYFSRG